MHCFENSSLSLCCGVQQPDAASFYSYLFSLDSSLQLMGKCEELMIYTESCFNLRTLYGGFDSRFGHIGGSFVW